MSIEPRLLVIATALVTACATDENPTEPDLAPASATVDARRYLVSDLGTLGGSYSYGFGINGAGEVVGVSATAAGQEHAFLWSGGVMTDLGTLDPSRVSSSAAGINDMGDVVGSSWSIGGLARAFLWRNGVMTPLFTFTGMLSVASAINNAGTIVGYAGFYPDARPALWRDGGLTDLGTLGGSFGQATDVNERGQVVGGTAVSSGDAPPIHAFLWEDGEMTDLGTLGGPTSWAQGINDDGEIVGWSETADRETHGVMWRKGRMIDLGPFEERQTYVYSINEKGVKVGFTTGGDAGPVVWRNRKARSLPTLGLPGGEATGVNESGQVVGSTLRRAGEPHAVLWRLE